MLLLPHPFKVAPAGAAAPPAAPQSPARAVMSVNGAVAAAREPTTLSCFLALDENGRLRR